MKSKKERIIQVAEINFILKAVVFSDIHIFIFLTILNNRNIKQFKFLMEFIIYR